MRAELSPTEERILGYIAEGLHDAEIAVRVGLPVGDVKARVNVLMQRRGLRDRAAVVEWYGAGPLGEPEGLTAYEDSGSRRAVVLLAGVGVVVAALLAAVLLLPEGDSPASGADVEGPTPVFGDGATPTAAEEATPTATATPFDRYTIGTGALTTGEAYLVRRLDANQSTISIDRVYLDPLASETVVVDSAWTPPAGWPDDENGEPGYIAVSAQGTRMAVGTYGGVLTVGTVGGAFSEPLQLPSTYFPSFWAGDKVAIAPTSEGLVFGWRLYDPGTGDLTQLQPPAGASAGPIGWTLRTGIIWPGNEGDFIDAGGKVVLHLEREPGLALLLVDDFVASENDGFDNSPVANGSPADDGFAALTYQVGHDRYLALVSLTTGRAVLTRSGGVAADAPLLVRGLASKGQFVGMLCRQETCRPTRFSIPGVLNLWLPQPLAGADGAYPEVLGSQRGPFGRVRADVGGCAPLLAAPGAAPDGRCLYAGDLVSLGELDITALVPKANVVEAGGVEYVCVYGLDGEVAWVEASLLEFRREFEEMRLR